ncbi:MAG: hypothetical protein ACO1OT_00910 [Heyndrickxia sp.]
MSKHRNNYSFALVDDRATRGRSRQSNEKINLTNDKGNGNGNGNGETTQRNNNDISQFLVAAAPGGNATVTVRNVALSTLTPSAVGGAGGVSVNVPINIPIQANVSLLNGSLDGNLNGNLNDNLSKNGSSNDEGIHVG